MEKFKMHCFETASSVSIGEKNKKKNTRHKNISLENKFSIGLDGHCWHLFENIHQNFNFIQALTGITFAWYTIECNRTISLHRSFHILTETQIHTRWYIWFHLKRRCNNCPKFLWNEYCMLMVAIWVTLYGKVFVLCMCITVDSWPKYILILKS